MPYAHRDVWVAIPARNERDRIVGCLTALSRQTGVSGRLTVVVIADSCTDDTLARIQGFEEVSPMRVEVLETSAGSAGRARRLGLDWAAARASAGDVLATTDADSCVAPDWLAATAAELDRGAQAVAGMIRFDPAELALARPCPARALEGRYAVLQAEITARADPRPHDPWPNHLWAWGASLAVRADVYRAVGGLPASPLAEDRAFVDLLERSDVRVRRSLDVRVTTSARTDGRAAGGLAHLVDQYRADADAPCDAALEAADDSYRRAALKRRLRRAFERSDALVEGCEAPHFGAAFARLEQTSTALARRRLHPGDLPVQIARAQVILRRLRAASGDQPGTSAADAEGLWPEMTPSRG